MMVDFSFIKLDPSIVSEPPPPDIQSEDLISYITVMIQKHLQKDQITFTVCSDIISYAPESAHPPMDSLKMIL